MPIQESAHADVANNGCYHVTVAKMILPIWLAILAPQPRHLHRHHPRQPPNLLSNGSHGQGRATCLSRCGRIASTLSSLVQVEFCTRLRALRHRRMSRNSLCRGQFPWLNPNLNSRAVTNFGGQGWGVVPGRSGLLAPMYIPSLLTVDFSFGIKPTVTRSGFRVT